MAWVAMRKNGLKFCLPILRCVTHGLFIEIAVKNRELNYWLREGRSSNAELDFVIELRGNIIPIEIKSGATGSLKSLHQFMGTKQAPFAVRFDTNLPTEQQIDTVINQNKQRKQVKYQLISLPLYLVESLDAVVGMLSRVSPRIKTNG